MKRDLDIEALEQATRLALAAGYRLFQTHRVSTDDAEQVSYLRAALCPPHGALVLDAGCGIGEVARLMHEQRPDLRFILANISLMQLAECPTGPAFHWLNADCLDLPLPAEHVDAVLFASALTQMDAKFALHEAARVLKPGGIVLLSEMVRTDGDGAEFEAVTTARVHTFDELEGYASAAGLHLDYGFTYEADDSHFRAMLRDLGREYLIEPIRPVIMRFIKG